MTGKNTIKHTQIDFRPARGFTSEADLIFTALTYYNHGSKTSLNSTQVIVEAYRVYNAGEPEELTRLINLHVLASAFVKKYGIKCKADFYRSLKDISVNEETELLVAGKKFISLDLDDPDAASLWELLDSVRFRDRGAVINKLLYQYFAHGNSEFYTDIATSRTFYWIKRYYEITRNISTEKIDALIEAILILAGEAISGNGSFNSGEKADSPDERLRKLMGML